MFVSLVGSFVPGTPGWEGRRWREPGQWGVSASHAAREASLPAPRPPHHVVVVLSFHSECVISSSYSAVLLLAAGGGVFKENYRKKQSSLTFATSSAILQALPSCLRSDPGFCLRVFQPEQLPLFPLVTHDCW